MGGPSRSQRRAYVRGQRLLRTTIAVLVTILFHTSCHVHAQTSTTTAASTATTTPAPVECPALVGGSSTGLFKLTLSLSDGVAAATQNGFAGRMGEPNSCVELLVPAGAWPEADSTPPEVTVVNLTPEAIAKLPAGATIEGAPVYAGPTGQVFTAPVALVMPVPTASSAFTLTMFSYDAATERWSEVAPVSDALILPRAPSCAVHVKGQLSSLQGCQRVFAVLKMPVTGAAPVCGEPCRIFGIVTGVIVGLVAFVALSAAFCKIALPPSEKAPTNPLGDFSAALHPSATAMPNTVSSQQTVTAQPGPMEMDGTDLRSVPYGQGAQGSPQYTGFQAFA